ncbi:iron chelate uptake ABC transporter family permease subunit [Leucobacter coleopterorum]|uniref:Iron chelate uptake ABC transporter family permease subunit n=1 Tax=Leucobacter coleopterorum TaxID=2714933 RepID=A0ABX6K0Q4_9MICO|nr:iron chelate uptake ABC transporter family permease subunit [Leucobacter coleopterorum]QIM19448.1 iron chelate uptake ABC transporter family permease subunit [Leucobacter coleopterorum]
MSTSERSPSAQNPAAPSAAATRVLKGRRQRQRSRTLITLTLVTITLVVCSATLLLGRTVYSPADALSVLMGDTVPGASFTIGELRLPRMVLGVLAGFAFGAAGSTFQTMLRNPLASPDVIGISAGASAAAVIGVVTLSLNETAVSFLALLGALVTAGAIALLSHQGGFSGIRFILIGIGIGAMLHSVTSYVLSRASDWNIQSAMQWLSGSLNGASWERVLPLLLACAVCVPLLMLGSSSLGTLRLGDDTARGLGVPVQLTRIALILAAVVLLAFATAATGPIAFVAFMAGPIAARLVGSSGSLLFPAGCVGALLVIASDFAGQFLVDTRYPVGVITGVLGAPYLLLLLIRMNRTGSKR